MNLLLDIFLLVSTAGEREGEEGNEGYKRRKKPTHIVPTAATTATERLLFNSFLVFDARFVLSFLIDAIRATISMFCRYFIIEIVA